MIKTSVRTVYNSVPALVALYGQKMPVKTAFRIRRIVAALQPILDSLEESRVALVQSLDDDGVGHVAESRMDEFNEQMDELYESEIEIQVEKLTLSELEKVGEIRPIDIDTISYIIEEN